MPRPDEGISALLTVYNILMLLAAGIGWPIVLPMALLTEKRRKTMPYRLGIVPPPVGKRFSRDVCRRRPIWVHALSVGEVLSALPLLQALRQRYGRRRVLLSVSTLTGFELANSREPASADAVFFSPYDIPHVVRRMTDSIDPALVVIVETDIWPNMVYHVHHRRIPLLLVNARLSPRTFAGYRRLRPIIGPTLNRFSKICTQSESETDRFHRLGVAKSRLVVTGNVKFDQPENPAAESQVTDLAEHLDIPEGAAVLVAGSTHNGEETMLADAFRGVRRNFPELRLVVVPRDPKRAVSVDRIFSAAGFSCRRLSDSDRQGTETGTDVLIVDVIGLLRALYRISRVSFVGGSLVARGGHNPLEPAACGKPILFGPHMTDFPDIARKLKEGGGAMEVHTPADIQRAVIHLMSTPERAGAMGRQAYSIYRANQGAVAKTLNVIGHLLPP